MTGPQTRRAEAAPPWRVRPSTMVGVRLIVAAGRRRAAVLGAMAVVEGLLPAVFAILGGRLVAAARAAADATPRGLSSPAGQRLLLTLAVVAALFVGGEVLASVRFALTEVFRERVELLRRERVMSAVLRPPGIGHLEDRDVLDLVQAAGRSDWPDTSAFAAAVFGTVSSRVTALASAAIVATYNVWLAIGLALVWLAVGRRLRAGEAAAWADRNAPLRKAAYLRDVAFDQLAAKELRVFGLPDWLLGRYTEAWHAVMRPVWKDRRRGRVEELALFGVLLAAHIVAFVILADAARRGDLSAARLVVLCPSIVAMSQFGVVNEYSIGLSLGAVFLPAVEDLERIVATDPRFVPTTGTPAGDLPARRVRFEDVTFAYPGRAAPVLDHLDLDIEVGTSLAIVGANGSGKTTLVKLLARLYEPTDGRITADGIDIRDIDATSWQGRVAAIFQDFVRYEMTAADNVGFGSLAHLGEIDRLRAAADRVGALQLVEALPGGWDTVLSRRFDGGAELSGGEWQRLALARALFALEGGSAILVLDEPTANLDVRGEVELFDRFLEVTRGATTVVISHRFSTVRRADRIVVLEHGRIVEDGTHEELLVAGGAYASAFRLQAARYQEADGSDADGSDAEDPDG